MLRNFKKSSHVAKMLGENPGSSYTQPISHAVDSVYPVTHVWYTLPGTITNIALSQKCSNKAKRKHLLKEAHISFRERRLFFSETMT